MGTDLLHLFNSLSEPDKPKYLRVPFGYIGGKSKSKSKILPHLPYRKVYVEPFGGSGAILLARDPCDLDVFNDRYAGVVAFYRCIRNAANVKKLIDRLDLTVHSREEFYWCKETWQGCSDDVERAARWYYMMQCSFANKGDHFGRNTKTKAQTGSKLKVNLSLFPMIHARMKNVQIENLDWYDCIRQYDGYDTVFYLDPPYLDAYDTYHHNFTLEDHQKLIEVIQTLKGFVALSGYDNNLYNSVKWDAKHHWQTFVSATSLAFTEANCQLNQENVVKRGHTQETLWIKEA